MSVSKNHPVFTPARPKGVFAPKKVMETESAEHSKIIRIDWMILILSRHLPGNLQSLSRFIPVISSSWHIPNTLQKPSRYLPQFIMNIFKIFEYQAPNTRYLNTNTKFSVNEYIRYSYSAKLWQTNIFDIRIWSGCNERIYSIFIFVRSVNMSIFDIRICKISLWRYV